MIVLETLDVHSYNPDSLDLTWSFESSPSETFSDYSIDVYRCEAPSSNISEYDLVASGVSSTAYSYSDTTLSGLHHPDRLWYYKFKVKHTSTGESEVYPEPPVYLQDLTTNKHHREIIRRKKLVLEKHSGRTLTLLKRRS